MHEYPWVWLRDNCQSEESFEAVSQCRIINLTEWDLGIRPKHVQNEEDRLVVTWEDGHVSPYDKTWLEARSFKSAARSRYRDRGVGEEQVAARACSHLQCITLVHLLSARCCGAAS